MPRRFGFLLSLLLTCLPALSQRLYSVRNFSPNYYGKVWLAKPNEVFSPGWVAVYEKASNKLLLKVSSDELAAEPAGDQVKAGVHELPYGEQSVLQYEDFNFDGVKDFAIEDGQNSCYHGPSFRIYLAQGHSFVFSKAFTELAQEYCGLFGVDKVHQRLSTSTKDGCCWHQFNEYVVRGNVPKVIKTVEEEARQLPYIETKTEVWNGKTMVHTTTTSLDLSTGDAKPVLSFKLMGSGKEVVVFSSEGVLNYALLKPTTRAVEFSYPTLYALTEDAKSSFTLQVNGPLRTLEFKNGSVLYRIYEKPAGSNPASIGIEVITKEKTVELTGNVASQKGSLAQLSALKLSNVEAP